MRMGEHVGAVNLEEVDMLHLHAGERGVKRLAQVCLARIIGCAGLDAAFGREDEPVAQGRRFLQHLAEQRFCRAEGTGIVEAVDIRRVEQRDPGFESCVDPRAGRLHLHTGKTPHAPGDGKDFEPALAERARVGRYGESGHEKGPFPVDCRAV
jgi:hypothetical protein